jgi:hypothetical protein
VELVIEIVKKKSHRKFQMVRDWRQVLRKLMEDDELSIDGSLPTPLPHYQAFSTINQPCTGSLCLNKLMYHLRWCTVLLIFLYFTCSPHVNL